VPLLSEEDKISVYEWLDAHPKEKRRGPEKHSEETKAKISAAKKGHKHSDETKAKIGKANKGRSLPQNKGKSPPQKGKTHEEYYGKEHADEMRRKNSEWHKNRVGWHFSEDAKKNMSESAKKLNRHTSTEFKCGDQHPNWKGGIPHKDRDYELREWRQITRYIRKRDNHICQRCGRSRSSVVHHIIPYRVSNDNTESNLVTLCPSCHSKVEYQTRMYIDEGLSAPEIRKRVISDFLMLIDRSHIRMV